MTQASTLQNLPAWRDDETLYSWCCNLHRLHGGGSALHTSKTLFGARHAYKERGAPSQMHYLSASTGKVLGDVKSILLQRTVLGAFYPFLTPAQRLHFDDVALAQKPILWLARFAMLASRLHQPSDLSWCPMCAEEDVDIWGSTRWRIGHQLPGVWWCEEHHIVLKRLRSTIAEWTVPPTVEICAPPENAISLTRAQQESLQLLGSLSKSLLGSGAVNCQLLARAVVSALRDQQVIPNSKPLSQEQLNRWFRSTAIHSALRVVSPDILQQLGDHWIYELLLRRRVRHPLLWMLLWVAVFTDLDASLLVSGLHRPELLLLWNEEGQGSLWLESSALGDSTIQRVVRDAPTLKTAATSLGVSTKSLRSYLRQNQCEPTHWHTQRDQQERKANCLDEIECFMRSTGFSSKKDVHIHCKAAVSWLRRWYPNALSTVLGTIPEQRSKQLEMFPR